MGLVRTGGNVRISTETGFVTNACGRKVISKDFLLDQNAIRECIEVATRAIGIFVSMADVARREERGFHHFMVWLRGRKLAISIMGVNSRDYSDSKYASRRPASQAKRRATRK